MLQLDPTHREWLEKESAISPAIIERAGWYSEYDAKAASKLLGRLPKHWDGHLPVLVIPYKMPFLRDPVRFRGRPLTPFEVPRDDGSVTLAKYVEAKGSAVHLFFGPSLLQDDGDALRDITRDLYITEGERKCLAAESKGLSCIALSGVTQWHLKGEKTLHPGFAHVALRGRKVRLCLDRDSLTNKQVRDQEIALARALEAAGAIVTIVRFPEDAPKLDDFLATHEFSEFAELLEDADKHGQIPPDTRAVTDDWKPVVAVLRKDDNGLPIKDVDTVTRVLMLHPAWEGVLAFDARHEQQTFEKSPPFDSAIAVDKAPIPRELIDSDATRIADWLVSQSCLGWTTQPQPAQIERAISITCERNRIDRVRDYLIALKWDAKPRLDAMGPTYFGCEDTPYVRAVFSKWMLSAVARARTPGCQVDHVLVLEGEQGIGKSTALKTLAGPGNFSDTLPEIPSRDAHEHCIGPWIIELAELDHMRKSEVTTLKAFISATAPKFRSAYGRRSGAHPRRCVFAATTNESGYLADPTGNRRFWPVECHKADSAGLLRDRDQLWAEALHRVRAGESWHITDPGVAAEVEEQQTARRQVDPWEPLILKHLGGKKTVTVGELLDFLGYGPEEASFSKPGRKGWQYDQRAANRVAAVLRGLGWVRRMIRDPEKGRYWRYESPAGERVTTPRGSGDRVETAQVSDFVGKSPVSPVSPVTSPISSNARDPNSSVIPFKDNSGDTGDSNDNGTISDTSGVTTASPVAPETSDSADPRPRRRL